MWKSGNRVPTGPAAVTHVDESTIGPDGAVVRKDPVVD